MYNLLVWKNLVKHSDPHYLTRNLKGQCRGKGWCFIIHEMILHA